MLIAEDLLLLLTADDTGKLAADSTNTDMALGGALLAELALTERVDIAGPDERVREGRLVVRDASPTGDSVLDEALATVLPTPACCERRRAGSSASSRPTVGRRSTPTTTRRSEPASSPPSATV